MPPSSGQKPLSCEQAAGARLSSIRRERRFMRIHPAVLVYRACAAARSRPGRRSKADLRSSLGEAQRIGSAVVSSGVSQRPLHGPLSLREGVDPGGVSADGFPGMKRTLMARRRSLRCAGDGARDAGLFARNHPTGSAHDASQRPRGSLSAEGAFRDEGVPTVRAGAREAGRLARAKPAAQNRPMHAAGGRRARRALRSTAGRTHTMRRQDRPRHAVVHRCDDRGSGVGAVSAGTGPRRRTNRCRSHWARRDIRHRFEVDARHCVHGRQSECSSSIPFSRRQRTAALHSNSGTTRAEAQADERPTGRARHRSRRAADAKRVGRNDGSLTCSNALNDNRLGLLTLRHEPFQLFDPIDDDVQVGRRHHGDYTARLAAIVAQSRPRLALFLSHRYERIHSERASCRHVTGQARDGKECQQDYRICRRVRGRDTPQRARDDPRQ